MSGREEIHQAQLLKAEDLLHAREIRAAITAFDEAERSGANADDCAAGRWTTWMLLGEFERAWCESDKIRRRGAPDPHRFWNGEDLRGQRVMLRCLHGLGDAVQFLRYVPLLRERAKRLIVEVSPAMLELGQWFDGVDEVITWGEQTPEIAPAWDVQVEVVELPYLFRTQLQELPLATNYLRVPPAVLAEAEREIGPAKHLRVGVVWSSGGWNPSRSVPFELLCPLLQTKGCEFWNLQGGRARQEWECLKERSTLHCAESCAGSLPRLAAFVAQMDLVITPDTLVAHLAGALRTPAWVMLQHEADWRWMRGREDSPWYPTLRLFRQHVQGDWRMVLERMQHALEQRTSPNVERRKVA